MSTFFIITVMVSVVVDNVGILIPEKEYGPLEHILVPKMIV